MATNPRLSGFPNVPSTVPTLGFRKLWLSHGKTTDTCWPKQPVTFSLTFTKKNDDFAHTHTQNPF